MKVEAVVTHVGINSFSFNSPNPTPGEPAVSGSASNLPPSPSPVKVGDKVTVTVHAA